MKIVLISNTFPPVMGGVETHVWGLATHLVKAGHGVWLMGYRNVDMTYLKGVNLPKDEVQEGINVVRVENDLGREIGDWGYWKGIHKAFSSVHRKGSIDVIHAHTVFPAGVIGAVLSYQYHVPLVITAHGHDVIGRRERSTTKGLLSFAMKRAKWVIGVSEEMSQASRDCSPRPERIVTMANAVDTDKFSPIVDGRILRQRFGIRDEDVLILALRRLALKTGIHLLLDALPEVKAQGVDYKVLLVGDGPERKNLEEQARQKGLNGKVIFAGNVDNALVPEYIAACDFGVFPSLVEATSIAALEVMACGKPVVASNVGGLPEIIEDGETGLLVDFGGIGADYGRRVVPDSVIHGLSSAITGMVKERQRCKQMGVKARRQVLKDFSWEGYVGKLTKLYKG